MKAVPILLLLGLATAPAVAHEFMVKPAKTEATAGAEIPIAALSSHVFMKGEELEAPEDVAVWVLHAGQQSAVALQPNKSTLAYEGSAKAPTGDGFLIHGARLAQIWSLTPEGLKPGTPAQLPGARRPMKIEKFSKTLINARQGDQAWSQMVGDRLEVVPLGNPADVKPGQDLRVRVLFDGQPLSTRVYATYDGFTEFPNSYAYYTETADDGTAPIRVTQPGLWMVRVEQRMDEKAADHEVYMARAVFLFRVP